MDGIAGRRWLKASQPSYPLAIIVAVDHFIEQAARGVTFLFVERPVLLWGLGFTLGGAEEAIQERSKIGIAKGFRGHAHTIEMQPSKSGRGKNRTSDATRARTTSPTATPARRMLMTVSS
jgi:hypothetical protein